MSRYRAAAFHFGISFLVFVGFTYLAAFVWYPGFLFEADGGWQGMKLLVLVGVVLGPVLTIVVFEAAKPGLRLDLATIGVLQAICLAAGACVLYWERPIALVYVDGQFFAMSADAYTEVDVEPPDLAKFPGDGPKWVMVDLPQDPIAQAHVRGEMWRAGKPLRTLTEYYAPFDARELTRSDAFASSSLRDRDRDAHAIDAWVGRHGGTLEDYRFYPFGARYAYRFFGFSEDRVFLGVLDTPAGA